MRYFKSGDFKTKKSRSLYPGEIIEVGQGEEVPADCLLLKVNNQRNVAYVETLNINNSKMLQMKRMPLFTEGIGETDPVEFINTYVNNTVHCDEPNKDLNSFNGSIDVVGGSIKVGYGKNYDHYVYI